MHESWSFTHPANIFRLNHKISSKQISASCSTSLCWFCVLLLLRFKTHYPRIWCILSFSVSVSRHFSFFFLSFPFVLIHKYILFFGWKATERKKKGDVFDEARFPFHDCGNIAKSFSLR